MELDPIQARREEESVKYGGWSGATKMAESRTESNAREIANQLLADARSGLRSGASKVVIDNSNKEAIELVKAELLPEELARITFSE